MSSRQAALITRIVGGLIAIAITASCGSEGTTASGTSSTGSEPPTSSTVLSLAARELGVWGEQLGLEDSVPEGAEVERTYLRDPCVIEPIDIDPPELYVGYAVDDDAVDAVAAELSSRFVDLGWSQSPEEEPGGYHIEVDGRAFLAGIRTDPSGVSVSVLASSDWSCSSGATGATATTTPPTDPPTTDEPGSTSTTAP